MGSSFLCLSKSSAKSGVKSLAIFRFMIIFGIGDDSQQDERHAYNVHAIRDKLIKDRFPHITRHFQDVDNGPHYAGTIKALFLTVAPGHTGIAQVYVNSCEPGEGKWFTDAQFSHEKARLKRNVEYNIADCTDAVSACLSSMAEGGGSSALAVVMDAESLNRSSNVVSVNNGAMKGLMPSKMRVKRAEEGGLRVWRSWGDGQPLGEGRFFSAATIKQAWQEPLGAPSATYFVPNEKDLVVSSIVKGTFAEERELRQERRREVEKKRALKTAEREAREAEERALLAETRTSVSCPFCGGDFSAEATSLRTPARSRGTV